MTEPIIRRTKIIEGTNYIRCSMDIPIRDSIKADADLKKMYLDFVDPTLDDGECLRRMAVLVDKFNHKPSTELELR